MSTDSPYIQRSKHLPMTAMVESHILGNASVSETGKGMPSGGSPEWNDPPMPSAAFLEPQGAVLHK